MGHNRNTNYQLICSIYSVTLTWFWGVVVFCLLIANGTTFAQTSPTTAGGTLGGSHKDTSAMSKSNTSKWKDEEAKAHYEKLNSAKLYTPDTSVHNFERRPFIQPWYKDLGNMGSAASNLMFTPDATFGPSLGYHVFDIYRFDADQMNFYNTNRPYSVFSYQLGSKQEQTAGLLHSQNIRPNWNITFEYRKINSPGFYKVQRTNHDNAYLSTNYKSLDKRYTLYATITYNKEQLDENGGIVQYGELSDPAYIDRKTVDVAYANDQYSLTRSTVSNVLRDFTFMLQHSYTWGEEDTTYSTDSTSYTYKLKPRFSLTHYFEVGSEKHEFKDLAPDSLQFTTLFAHTFLSSTPGYYTPGEDSVETQQKWVWIENKIMLNGFLGKSEDPLKFSIGAGNRYDVFTSKPVYNIIKDSLPNLDYSLGQDQTTMLNSYLAGNIMKEALRPGDWEYGITGKYIFSGSYSGNMQANAEIGKTFDSSKGSIVAGVSQQISDAPYNMTHIENRFVRLDYTFNQQSISSVYFSVDFRKLRLTAGVKAFVINNYFYINDSEKPAQYNIPFNVTAFWIRKVFKAGNWYLDNELVYQQAPVNAPVNVPALMGRHALSYERSMFKNAIKIATGAEVRYQTSYNLPGYDAILNQFFYQNNSYVSNNPEFSIFLNFRVKHLRAFVMVDQLQQVFLSNTINYVGTPVINYNGSGYNYVPVYAAQNTMVRFGFSWVLIN